MALIVVAADKGAPGVTTTALALASVWPSPVLLAECDPAGGDLMFRFPAVDGRQLDPRRGLLSLAVAGRRDYQQQQVWPHAQKIHGGLDVLVGVTNAEQGAGLTAMWQPLGAMLAALPGADVIADCGRLGPDGPAYDLLAEAATVVLVTRPDLGDVIRLRDRATAIMASAQRRGRRGISLGVLVIADPKNLKAAQEEVAHALHQAGVPVRLVGGMADDQKGAELLSGTWGGRLDKALLIRTAREVAGQLVAEVAGPAPVPSRAPAVAPPPPHPSGPGSSGRHTAGPHSSDQYPPDPQPQRTGPRHGEPRPGESRPTQQAVPLDGSRGR
jgi:hypothetical protein